MKKLLGSITVALAIIVAAGAASAADKLKVGFIYVGPIGDHGWSYQPVSYTHLTLPTKA